MESKMAQQKLVVKGGFLTPAPPANCVSLLVMSQFPYLWNRNDDKIVPTSEGQGGVKELMCVACLKQPGACREGGVSDRVPALGAPFSGMWAPQGAQLVKNPPANATEARDAGSVRGWGRCPGEGNGNPRQYSCLGNPTDRGAWWAAVPRITESWTSLSTHTFGTISRAGWLRPACLQWAKSR